MPIPFRHANEVEELGLSGEQRETHDKAEKDGVLQLKQKGESVRIENVLHSEVLPLAEVIAKYLKPKLK